MQVDNESKIIYVHIPRTGGSWFSYAWDSNTNIGRINLRGKYLTNNENGKRVLCGRHGHLSGILKKLDEIEYDYKDHKIITLIRHPVDRLASSWAWFSKVKNTAEKHGWKSIHDMIDEYESGKVRANYMPQTFWLCEDNAKFDYIFKFEDLLQGDDLIREHFPLFRKHKKGGGLRRSGELGGYGSQLSPDEIERIKKVYKEDIDYLKNYYEDLK